MARTPTWRRGWNAEAFTTDLGFLDLAVVQPGETLSGTWWQYQMTSLGSAQTTTSVPLQGAVVIVTLSMVPESSQWVQPFQDPNGPWLWWESVTFAPVLYDPNQGAYVNWATSGIQQKKIKAMRRNDLTVNQVVRFSWQTDPGSATAAETAFSVRANASCLVLEAP